MSKKRLSFKQIAKKEKLLSTTRENIKGLHKNQISKVWEKYRGKKFTIENLPKFRKQLYHSDAKQKELIRSKYFDRKEIAQKHLEFGSLVITKKHHGTQSQMDYYKLAKGKDLDSTVERIFDNKKVRYILVTLKIRLPESDVTQYISDVFTPESFEQMKENYNNIMEKILEKLSLVAKYDGWELVSQHIRLIYANPEETNRLKNNGKNKR